MLNMDLLIEQSKHKDGLYKSNILQEVSLTKEDIDKVRSRNYGLNNATSDFIDDDYNKSKMNIKSIYEDENNRKFYVMKGDVPFIDKNLITINKTKNEIPEFFNIPSEGTTAALTAGPAALGTLIVALSVASGGIVPVTLGLGIVATSVVTSSMFLMAAATNIGISIYNGSINDNFYKNKEEITDKILKQIDTNKNQIDITSLFQDPYIDSFTLIANQKEYNNEYLVPEDLRKEIMSFEIKKENLSKGIKDITEIYEVLKSNPNTTKDDLVNIENELKSLLSSFNSDKNKLTNMISTQVDKYKDFVSSNDSLKETIKDINFMNHLEFRKNYEIAQLNSMITLNNDSGFENINKAYGKDEISRIEGHVHLLSLALSTNSIQGNEDIKNIVYTLSNQMKNFSELSIEDKKMVINNYEKLGKDINSYIGKIDANSNLELNKDYINKEAISKLIEKIEKNELNYERNI